MKFVLPTIFFTALIVLHGADARLVGSGNANANSNGNGNGNGNGNANNGGNANGPPDFLTEDELPPGLVDNPSGVVGVNFKPGRKVAAQKLPDKANPRRPIRGLDNRAIELNTQVAEPINVFDPVEYLLSDDGTFVTDVRSGVTIPLFVFYLNDEANGMDVTFSLDDNGDIAHVRIAPKDVPDEAGNEAVPVQNFQRLSGSDVLVGYFDDDMDLSQLPAYGDPVNSDAVNEKPSNISSTLAPIPEEGEEDGDNGTRRRGLVGNKATHSDTDGDTRRRAQATSTASAYGKTCNVWDYLGVNIVTDQTFSNYYSSHSSQAQAIFAEAQKIYWKESCVWLYMPRYENSVGDSDWTWGTTTFDAYLRYYGQQYGCNGALDILAFFGKNKRPSENRDVWHLFSHSNWQGAAGCAWVNTCKSADTGYGVSRFNWTTNLRLQAVTFAHELGHNLGLNHLSSSNGYYVMEAAASPARYDLHPTYANYVRDKVVYSSNCGWY
jgi:hypothetical protein